MKRWNGIDNVENKKIDLFLNEIKLLCEKYNFSISHEDRHGAFEIEKYNKDCMEWFCNANDKT